ncbi:MAG TPA: phage holin family protein [Burkholderiales bacterium]
MRFLLAWLVNTLALIAVAYLMPSITVSSFGAALIAALVLGLVNAIVRPVLVLLTLPVTILTLGLFIFVLNGLLFWMVASWLEGFNVAGFWSGVLGAILFSLVSWLLSALVQR